MGFVYKKYRKDIYYDGHEREDVVNYRKEFLQKMNDLEPLMPEFSDVSTFLHSNLSFLGTNSNVLFSVPH